jgi:hypothetical protein
VRIALGKIDRPVEKRHTSTRELGWITKKREIVNGGHYRRSSRRHRHPCGMNDIDSTGGTFDTGPSEAMPCLVERESRKRKLSHIN